ncbi:MAG: response regulator [Planctomycetales bacterium]|nr:response regulator [Planctomycetales bacterium]
MSYLDALRAGVIAAKAGKRMLARIQIEQATEIDSHQPEAWLWMAWLADSTTQASEYVEIALARSPNHPVATRFLELLDELNEFDPDAALVEESAEAVEADSVIGSEDVAQPWGTAEGESLAAPASELDESDTLASDLEALLEASAEPENEPTGDYDEPTAVEEPVEAVAEYETVDTEANHPDSGYSGCETLALDDETRAFLKSRAAFDALSMEENADNAADVDSWDSYEPIDEVPLEPTDLDEEPSETPIAGQNVELPILDAIEVESYLDANEEELVLTDAEIELVSEAEELTVVDDSETSCETSDRAWEESVADGSADEPADGFVRDDDSEIRDLPTVDEILAAATDTETSVEDDVLAQTTDLRRETAAAVEVQAEADVPVEVCPPSPPVAEVTPSPDASLSTSAESIDAAAVPTEAGRTILAVDDSPTVLKLVEMTLQSAGYEVVTAPNGVDAMKLLATMTPAMVLLDVNMPRMDGYKLCKLLKSHDKTRLIPVVMLSGKDGLFDKLRGKLVGCDNYISKPFESADLLQHVARYVPAPTTVG